MSVNHSLITNTVTMLDQHHTRFVMRMRLHLIGVHSNSTPGGITSTTLPQLHINTALRGTGGDSGDIPGMDINILRLDIKHT